MNVYMASFCCRSARKELSRNDHETKAINKAENTRVPLLISASPPSVSFHANVQSNNSRKYDCAPESYTPIRSYTEKLEWAWLYARSARNLVTETNGSDLDT